MPIPKLILVSYVNVAKTLVKIPFTDSILLNILQLQNQQCSQINKQGVQIRSVGGGGISENLQEEGRLLGTKE